MGASFTNVQVFVGDQDPAEATSAVVSSLRTILSNDYDESDANAEADRATTVAPSLGGWVSVYDEQLDTQAEQPLIAFATALSARWSVVTLLVHDSDLLDARLYEGGALVDHYVSNPDFLELPRRERPAVRGNPDKWSRVLRQGVKPAQLRRAWKADPLFSELLVQEMAPLLGVDPGRAQGSMRHLDEVEGSDGFVRLFWRARQPQKASSPSATPSFELAGWNPSCELSVGEPLTGLGFSFMNRGAACRDLAIAASGDAIRQGLVNLEAVQLALHIPKRDKPAEFLRVETTFTSVSEMAALVARFPDFEAPALGHVFVTVVGAANQPGSAVLALTALPASHPTQGATQSTRITVGPAGRRPLRALPGRETQIRALENPQMLSMVVALPGDAEGTRIAVNAIVGWNARVAGKDTWNVTVMSGLGSKPKMSRLKAGDVTDRSKKWTAVVHAIESAGLLSASITDMSNAASLGLRVFHGPTFSIERGSRIYAEKDPPLTLGLGTPRGTDDDASYLAAAADAAVAAGALQAFIARWDWTPSMSLGTTPYEMACGINGQVTTTRHWLERWLRSVTPQVWLGATLRSFVNFDELRACAEVTEQGPGIRIRLAPGRSLDDLERVLAPVLPGEQDWQKASQELRPTLPDMGAVAGLLGLAKKDSGKR